MSELLLIDDDQELCELLTSWLGQEGFQVRACHDGLSARKALAQAAPAAVVLDVMLPDGSGLELLKQLRTDHAELPVLMLSARGEPLDRILGLELGDLCFSPVRGVVTIDEQEFSLTLSESRLLEALLRQPGEPLDKQELAQIALGRKLTLYDRSLDMHVSNLRKKIGPHPDGRPRIVALRSRGYYYSL
ncbi:MAG: Transcriptional regulatory protein CpxR [Pseudomonas fluorescens]|nr:MAG: Transcriptional regulatory protein CpxR [Pseudomonas fluorescens]